MRIQSIFLKGVFAIGMWWLTALSLATAGPISISETFNGFTGSYTVVNNSDFTLTGFGVSNRDSEAFVAFGGNFSEGSVSITYEAQTLNSDNWGVEIVADTESTFEDLFGIFGDNVEGSENIINWYQAVGGDIGAGGLEPGEGATVTDFFRFIGFPQSIGLALLGNGTVITGITLNAPNAVPLPAALPLFGTGLAVMGFVGWRRKRKLSA